MTAEVTPAAVVLCALLAVLLVVDASSRRRAGRHLWVQAFVFVVGGVLIVFPEISRQFARLVGIGRGVDFVLYPLVIWLVRESLLTRRRRHEDEERMTELVRAIALERAASVSAADAEAVAVRSSPPGSSPRAP